MTLDPSSLMLIQHDCVKKARQFLQQWIRSDEIATVINLMRHLIRLQLRGDDAIHQCFIRAQELVYRLHHAGEELSETLFNEMVLNGLPQCYEHFVLQESLNPALNFVEIQCRIEESRRQRDDLNEDQFVAMSAKKVSHQIALYTLLMRIISASMQITSVHTKTQCQPSEKFLLAKTYLFTKPFLKIVKPIKIQKVIQKPKNVCLLVTQISKQLICCKTKNQDKKMLPLETLCSAKTIHQVSKTKPTKK